MRFRPNPLAGAFSFALGCGASFFGGSNTLVSTSAQRLVAALELSQEKMSAHPSTPLVLNNFSCHQKKKKSPILVESLAKQAEPELAGWSSALLCPMGTVTTPAVCFSLGLHGQG